MGPLIPVWNLEKFAELFPVYHATQPIANKTIPPQVDDEGSARKPAKIPKEKVPEETFSVFKTEREIFQLDYIIEHLWPFLSCHMLVKPYLDWLTKI